MPSLAAADRTDLLRAVLRERHPATRFVLIEEVGNATGFGCLGWADALILDLWPSAGLTLTGVEIKATREDLKKELRNPKKAAKVGKYCDRWILLAYDRGVLKDLEIPEAWGIWTLRDRELGDGFEVVRRPAVNREPAPWSRAFVCAMLRAAQRTSPAAAFVARAIREVRDRGRAETSASFRRLLAENQDAAEKIDRLSAEIRRLGGNPYDALYRPVTRTGRPV